MTREYDLFTALPEGPPPPRDPWHAQVRRIAKRHAATDNWLDRRWSCECGACNRARLDGFLPRQWVERLTEWPQRHRGESQSRRPIARSISPRVLL
jgi:hypothetical protein